MSGAGSAEAVQNPSMTVPDHPEELTVTTAVADARGASSDARVGAAGRTDATNEDTWLAAAASDGYVATVTPGEAVFGGRPLLMSLVEDGTTLTQPGLSRSRRWRGRHPATTRRAR